MSGPTWRCNTSVQARGANGSAKAILAQPQKEGGQGQDGLDCIRPSNMFLLFYFLFFYSKSQIQKSNLIQSSKVSKIKCTSK
jgi:hypothetical protein